MANRGLTKGQRITPLNSLGLEFGLGSRLGALVNVEHGGVHRKGSLG
jgi:hypothetical protein